MDIQKLTLTLAANTAQMQRECIKRSSSFTHACMTCTLEVSVRQLAVRLSQTHTIHDVACFLELYVLAPSKVTSERVLTCASAHS